MSLWEGEYFAIFNKSLNGKIISFFYNKNGKTAIIKHEMIIKWVLYNIEPKSSMYNQLF